MSTKYKSQSEYFYVKAKMRVCDFPSLTGMGGPQVVAFLEETLQSSKPHSQCVRFPAAVQS